MESRYHHDLRIDCGVEGKFRASCPWLVTSYILYPILDVAITFVPLRRGTAWYSELGVPVSGVSTASRGQRMTSFFHPVRR